MLDDVWWCLNSINHWIKQHQTFLLSPCLVRLARCIKHVWVAHARCVIADSAMLKLLWYSVWFCGPKLLAFGCLTMFDKTSLNRLARASNIKMFDHQTMFVNVWSSNTSRLARALKCIWNEHFYFAFASCYMSNKQFENLKNIFIFFFAKSRHFLPKKSDSELKLGCFELEKTRNLFFFFILSFFLK